MGFELDLKQSVLLFLLTKSLKKCQIEFKELPQITSQFVIGITSFTIFSQKGNDDMKER